MFFCNYILVLELGVGGFSGDLDCMLLLILFKEKRYYFILCNVILNILYFLVVIKIM